jgi:predicted AAA+ superfamily ATPase
MQIARLEVGVYERTLSAALLAAASEFPVVSLTGPRQSGKTTLAQSAFPDHRYVSLEAPDTREFALDDPRGFLAQFDDEPVVLDEVQRTPDLFSYIQVAVDSAPVPGRFILTGSHNFLIMQEISQSLAGRSAILHLLPLSLAELHRRTPTPVEEMPSVSHVSQPSTSLNDTLFSGQYPRIHAAAMSPSTWLGSYYQTYLERDVRSVLGVGDLETFSRFVRLCAGRTGQILSLTGLATDCGISHTTARRWLSVLEASFIVTLLRPHHRNYGKRLVKRPKLYFLDTGLLCSLLRIRSSEELVHHAMRGPVFESLIVSELLKGFYHRGEIPGLHFWRDSAGHEVDVIVDLGEQIMALEAKSSQTLHAESQAGLRYWRALRSDGDSGAVIVYGGNESYVRNGVTIRPWYSL